MRKLVTNTVGYITAAAIMVAAALKITHLPGAAAALNFTGLLLSVYFPLYIIDKMSGGERVSALHYIAAASALFTDLGITFRLAHWPGAGILLAGGLAGFALIFVPLLWMEKAKQMPGRKLMNAAGGLGLSLLP